jgi:hypothetical protein
MALYKDVSFQIGKQVPARFRGFITLPVFEGSKETVAPDIALKRIIAKTQKDIAFFLNSINPPFFYIIYALLFFS